MGEPGAALAGEITRQLNLLRQRQHVRIEPGAEQHLGLDILRGAVRFRLAENAGEAAEDLQEGVNGGVVEGHAMLFRDLDGCWPNGACHKWEELWNNTTLSGAKPGRKLPCRLSRRCGRLRACAA